MATAAIAVIQRKEREIVDTFRSAGATSPAYARDPEELGVNQHLAFDRLAQRAILRDAGDGKYYLDEPSWNALRSLRHRIAFAMIAIAVLLAVVLLVTGFLASRA